jgi:hypothetical protein
MKKGINLQANTHVGSGAAVANLSQALPAAFAQANPGLQLTVKSMSPVDAQGHASIHVYIEGEQEPAADFAALTRAALNKAIAALNSGASSAPAAPGAAAAHPPVHLHDVKEVEDDDEDSGLVLPPARQPAASPAGSPAPPPPAATPPSSQSSAAATASRSPWWAVWRRGKQ